jgi:hypothetical protein
VKSDEVDAPDLQLREPEILRASEVLLCSFPSYPVGQLVRLVGASITRVVVISLIIVFTDANLCGIAKDYQVVLMILSDGQVYVLVRYHLMELSEVE